MTNLSRQGADNNNTRSRSLFVPARIWPININWERMLVGVGDEHGTHCLHRSNQRADGA